MSISDLERRARVLIKETFPLPALGQTAERLQDLYAIGREDLSLAKVMEAHWDAIAILAEAGRQAEPGLLYAVWASESPSQALQVNQNDRIFTLNGKKMVCSGAGLVDRALMTVRNEDDHVSNQLIDFDLRNLVPEKVCISSEPWISSAFAETKTSTLTFHEAPVSEKDFIGDSDWYLRRTGFWQGAIGPAACWAGGAAGLLDYASKSKRYDPHTLAHLAAMEANCWAMKSILQGAGQEIDAHPRDVNHAQELALKVRHLIEQFSTDILRRFARAYGPYPLACESALSRRYQELDLFLRQCHAERDLENLGQLLKKQAY